MQTVIQLSTKTFSIYNCSNNCILHAKTNSIVTIKISQTNCRLVRLTPINYAKNNCQNRLYVNVIIANIIIARIVENRNSKKISAPDTSRTVIITFASNLNTAHTIKKFIRI